MNGSDKKLSQNFNKTDFYMTNSFYKDLSNVLHIYFISS